MRNFLPLSNQVFYCLSYFLAKRSLFFVLLCLFSFSFSFKNAAFASSAKKEEKSEAHGAEGEEGKSHELTEFFEVRPPFIVNYASDKVHYFKVGVSFKGKGVAPKETMTHHAPWIKNNLILLFSKQDEETLRSAEGRISLKEAVKVEVNSIMKQEGEQVEIIDVLFTDYLVE